MKASVPITCLLLLHLGACAASRPGSPHPRRDGPDFQVAFPNAQVLVDTGEVHEVQQLLRTVELPETKQHHDRLRELLAKTASLDTDHLLLLTEAVAVPKEAISQVHSWSTEHGEIWWVRSAGPFTSTIDDLLIAGVPKLKDPSPVNFGRLLARTQSAESLVRLVQLCAELPSAARWDDGSPEAFDQTLDRCLVDQVRAELCLRALLPLGRLDEARAELALNAMNSDPGRLELLEADYARRASLDPEQAARHVEVFGFDAGRVRAAQLAAPLLESLPGAEALRLVKAASFDAGRVGILKAISASVRLKSSSQALALVRCASFEAGREEILEALWNGPFLRLSPSELVEFVGLASFDAGRLAILRGLRKHLVGSVDGGTLRELLEAVSFDPARQEIIELFGPDMRRLSPEERRSVLEGFSFAHGRQQAEAFLNG